jgi:hypothetical protein
MGHFPPSSSVTGVRCLAAAAIIILPTLAFPVVKHKDEIAEKFPQQQFVGKHDNKCSNNHVRVAHKVSKTSPLS